jgi:antitoxin PrlF
MAATLEVESTLTDRYQTTVPETVRRALKLGKRDKIHYTIRPSGEVVLTRAEASDVDDPVLEVGVRLMTGINSWLRRTKNRAFT